MIHLVEASVGFRKGQSEVSVEGSAIQLHPKLVMVMACRQRGLALLASVPVLPPPLSGCKILSKVDAVSPLCLCVINEYKQFSGTSTAARVRP